MHVLTLRNGFVETAHAVHAAAVQVDPNGNDRVIWQTGEPMSALWRSAAKPFQLRTSLLALAEGDHTDTFSEEELAVGAASHSAQVVHLAVVHRLLARFGLGPDALRCGPHPPMHEPTWHAMIRSGESVGAIHNNCSGKHAFMLGACVANGWSRDYLDPSHPLQQQVLRTVRRWTQEPVGVGVDHCGVPTFFVSIAGMARAWATLALAMAQPARDPVASRIGRAMAAHPRLTSGDDRLDLALARLAREPYLGKIGAAGLFCVALPERSVGIAVKVATGDWDALAVAVPAVLRAVAPGSLDRPSEPWPWDDILNAAGRLVGQRVAVGYPRA